MKISRDVWSFGIYSILSVIIMSNTFQWLEHENVMTSDVALEKAEQTLQQYYAHHRKNAEGIHLTNAIAPDRKKEKWQFQFQPAHGKPITVEVADNGQASVLQRPVH